MTGISPVVSKFIARFIDSVEGLEVLLTLREHSDRSWSPSEVAKELSATLSAIELRMDQLRKHGLLQVDKEGRYTFVAGKYEKDLNEVAVAYRTRRTRLIELIFKPRDTAIESFSDAFRVRRED